MRAAFGIVSLLIVLAVVGLVARQQMRIADTAALGAASSAPPASGASVKQGAEQIQRQILNDAAKAAEQASQVREAADK